MPSEVREISVEEADKAALNGIGREAAESTATSTELGGVSNWCYLRTRD